MLYIQENQTVYHPYLHVQPKVPQPTSKQTTYYGKPHQEVMKKVKKEKTIWLKWKGKKETWSEEEVKKTLKDWTRDEQETKEAYKKGRSKMKETIRIKLHLCWCGSQGETKTSKKLIKAHFKRD